MQAENAENSAPERFHPRVDANFMVKVLINGRAVVAKARDLSMAGLYLLAKPPVSTTELTLSIPLPGDREVVTTARVCRWHAEGVALEFDQLDWDDLFALARFLHPRLP
ncbi:MAG: PilZ domain-containing protein [Myxococcaceae bacterium]